MFPPRFLTTGANLFSPVRFETG